MNYCGYKPLDVVNGEGTRNSLFVSGCSHMCRGCFSKKTWNPTYGETFTLEVEDKIINDLNSDRIKLDGISLLGGDPLHGNNLLGIYKLVYRIKKQCKGKTIWLWTGYTKSDIMDYKDVRGDFNENYYMHLRKKILSLIDVLVDGKFEQSLYDPSLKFRGSSNQNVIYMEKQ